MKNFKWRRVEKCGPLRKKCGPLRKKWRLRRIKCGPRRNVPGPGTKKCGPLRKVPGPGTKKCRPLMKKCGPLRKKCGPPGSSLWHCSKCRCRKCSVLAFARACSPLSPMPQHVAPPGKSQPPEATTLLHPLPLVLRAYASAWRVASCALCRRAAVRLKNTADRCFSAVLFCRLKKKS